MVTHMGQLPGDHVTLEGAVGAAATDIDFFRVGQDGIKETAVFSPPATKSLVVTEVDWFTLGGAAPGELKTLRISIVDMASGRSNIVFETFVALNNSGQGGRNQEIKSGFVVSSKGKIRAAASTPGAATDHIILRGYLTKV